MVELEPSGTQPDIIVSQNRPRNRRVVFDLGSQILLFKTLQDLKIPLRRIGLCLGSQRRAGWLNHQAQEQSSQLEATFRLQLRAKKLRGS